MSNTAKHFTCYGALILGLLFLFGLYHTLDLKYAASQQTLVDASQTTAKTIANSQKQIEDRDAELKSLNARLDKASDDAKTLAEQVALVNQLLPTLKQPLTVTTALPQYGPLKPGLTPPTGPSSITEGVWVSVEDVKALSDNAVACQKCANAQIVAQLDIGNLQTDLAAQQKLLTDYKMVESKYPKTRFQKFRKGLRWVLFLGR